MQRVNILLGGHQHLKDDVYTAIVGSLDHTALTGEVVLRDPTHPLRRETTLTICADALESAGREIEEWHLSILVCSLADPASITAIADAPLPPLAHGPIPSLVCCLVPPEKVDQRADCVALLDEVKGAVAARSAFYGVIEVTYSSPPLLQRSDLADLLRSAVVIGVAPQHVLWDERLQRVTIAGVRALRKAFWLIDRDRDGLLNAAEVQIWQNKMFNNEANDDDVAAVLQYVRTLEEQQQAEEPGANPLLDGSDRLTWRGFLALTHVMLLEGRHRAVWALLADCGIRTDAQSHSPRDIAAVKVSSRQYTTLSSSGATFFAAIIANNKFCSVEAMWAMTPGCPWDDVAGLNADDGSSESAIAFVERWRFMAIHRRQQVIQYARTWGFQGDVNRLFVKRSKRGARVANAAEDGAPYVPPNTIQVLVIGSRGCGKSALLHSICGTSPDELHRVSTAPPRPSAAGRTLVLPATVVAESGSGVNEEPTTILFTEPSETEAAAFACSRERMAAIDLVLLLFDGTDPYSLAFAMDLHASMTRSVGRVPTIVVLTKGDEQVVDQQCGADPAAWALRSELLWPPLITSAVSDVCAGLEDSTEALAPTIVRIMELDDAAQAAALAHMDTSGTDADGNGSAKHDPKPLTWGRIARRTFIVGAGVLALTFLIRRAFRRHN